MKPAKTTLIIIAVILAFLLLRFVFQKKDLSPQILNCENSLSQVLTSFGIGNDLLITQSRTIKSDFKRRWLFIDKEYRVPYSVDIGSLQDALSSDKKTAPVKLESIQKELTKDKRTVTLEFSLDKLAVIRLTLKAQTIKGKIAIVLDDWGYSDRLIDKALKLNIPLNIAILPNHAFSEKTAREMKNAGHFILLHLPMEPHNAASQPLEENTIMSGMNKEQITAILDKDFSSVPFIGAVNNHMGSKATEDGELLSTVFDYLKSKNIFFLDSYTSGKSIAQKIAAEKGLPYLQRQVFLDDTSDRDSIAAEFNHAKRLALKNGRAIAIGHDKELTLETLKNFIPEAKKDGIKFVYLPELLKDEMKK